MKLFFSTRIKWPVEETRKNFNQDLFSYLSRGPVPFELLRFDGCSTGDEVHIKIGVGPLSFRWISLITFDENNAAGWSFVDEGKVLPWPLKSWKHHHRVDRISANESDIIDDVHYTCESEILSHMVKPFVWMMLAVRPSRYRNFFKD